MSRFVSGGTNDEPTERDEQWLKAQQEIDAKRLDEAERARQAGGSSLYETLQANKAAKQEKFEESIRLKNQFRNLDEDEVEFLDSVLESTRAQEAAVKQETDEQLKAFRKQREEAEQAMRDSMKTEEVPVVAESWSVGPRKRKKARNDALGGVKLRRTSTTGSSEATKEAGPESKAVDAKAASPSASSPLPRSGSQGCDDQGKNRSAVATVAVTVPPVSALGLAAYSSDEEDP